MAAQDSKWQELEEALKSCSPVIDPLYSLQDGLIYYHNRWFVPNSRELRLEILSDDHDSRVAGRYGQFKTTERIMGNFYWPNMDQDVTEYVRSCDNCQRNKISR